MCPDYITGTFLLNTNNLSSLWLLGWIRWRAAAASAAIGVAETRTILGTEMCTNSV